MSSVSKSGLHQRMFQFRFSCLWLSPGLLHRLFRSLALQRVFTVSTSSYRKYSSALTALNISRSASSSSQVANSCCKLAVRSTRGRRCCGDVWVREVVDTAERALTSWMTDRMFWYSFTLERSFFRKFFSFLPDLMVWTSWCTNVPSYNLKHSQMESGSSLIISDRWKHDNL